MAYSINSPALREFPFEDFQITYLISGGATEADVGKAVSQDVAADGTVKLAADGDTIMGRADTVTVRAQEGVTTCGVSRKFIGRLPIKAGLTGVNVVVRGSTVVGAGAGEVKARVVSAAAAPDANINIVTAIDDTFAIVEML